jgi:hypothetical protein
MSRTKPRVPKPYRLDTVLGVRVTRAEANAILAMRPLGKTTCKWLREVVLARLGLPRTKAGYDGAREAGVL